MAIIFNLSANTTPIPSTPITPVISTVSAYDTISIPLYDIPETYFTDKRCVKFSKKDVKRICNKLHLSKINYHEELKSTMADDLYLNDKGERLHVMILHYDYRYHFGNLTCFISITNNQGDKLFGHSIHIGSYKDLRRFIEFAFKVKKAFMS